MAIAGPSVELFDALPDTTFDSISAVSSVVENPPLKVFHERRYPDFTVFGYKANARSVALIVEIKNLPSGDLPEEELIADGMADMYLQVRIQAQLAFH